MRFIFYYFACRTCVERTDRGSLNRDSLIDMVGMVLDNAGIAVGLAGFCFNF